jgi:ammonium transporter, Amt family
MNSAIGLAFLVPIGYLLIAAGGLPAQRARHAAVSFFAALGLALVGYLLTGFALQYGGIGLVYDRPGFDGLIWEWSALGPTWGPGWGMAGLAGWLLSGPAATTAARELVLANLPPVVMAAAIPVIALRGRAPAWAAAIAGLLMGGLIYPVLGNWLWGGGWLANLGANVEIGHGFVDLAGAGTVHVAGAAAALAGLLVFLPRSPRAERGGEPVPLPPAYLPLLSLVGAGLLLAGVVPWVTLNPLIDPRLPDTSRILLNTILAAAGGALVPLAYTWLVARQPDPLMASRGLGASVSAAMGCALFLPAWASLALGAVIGLLIPFTVFLVDRVLRWQDDTAALAVHGLGGAAGLLAVGLLADGTAGAGWAGIGTGAYLGSAHQGVTGWLASTGFRADWPGQMQAQLIGLAALALFSFFATWIVLAPPATLARLLSPRRAPAEAAVQPAPEPVPAAAVSESPELADEEPTPADEDEEVELYPPFAAETAASGG